jgi:hypothetical protein
MDASPIGVVVYTGSELARAMGFTDELFFGHLEICEAPMGYNNHILYVHYINSLRPGQGNVTRLFSDWTKKYELRVVKPVDNMKELLTNMGGFAETYENIPHRYRHGSIVEVWWHPGPEKD